MKTDLFDYHLPPELIARHPPPERDAGRLLVLTESGVEHKSVRDWPERVPRGALVVVNVTKVRHARVVGRRRGSQGRVEFLLLDRLDPEGCDNRWSALGRANRPLREGQVVDGDRIVITVERTLADGRLEVLLTGCADVEQYLVEHGRVPIPPYLDREDDAADRERYQTIFARKLGSVAAPTAGLHLTESMLAALSIRDVEIGEVTLHVGLGTFRPVVSDDLDDHVMHAEKVQITDELASKVESARSRGAPVIAVGTTVVRALESAADRTRPGRILARGGETSLFVQPGYRFSVVDGLFTNFHQPRSTLLALVAAFAGREHVFAAYREAISQGYRFLSYGDAMWIPRRIAC